MSEVAGGAVMLKPKTGGELKAGPRRRVDVHCQRVSGGQGRGMKPTGEVSWPPKRCVQNGATKKRADAYSS